MRKWLRNAFALDPDGPTDEGGDVVPTTEQQAIIDRLCQSVRRRGLTVPAQMALELARPLNFLTAQALYVVSPFLRGAFDAKAQDELARFLERRGSIDYIVKRLQKADDSDSPAESEPSSEFDATLKTNPPTKTDPSPSPPDSKPEA